MRQLPNLSLPQEVFTFYNTLKPTFDKRKGWKGMEEQQIWAELCLCILSSNVPFELARSSTNHLFKEGMLDTKWLLRTNRAKQIIAKELSKPIYLPVKKDGEFRKYRFPRVRARDIVESARTIYAADGSMYETLSTSASDKELRNALAMDIPGLGLKEASHFLRNIGFSSHLAIIDVHVISFLKYLGLIPQRELTLTPNLYFEIENMVQKISASYQLDLAVLDNAIWHFMRNRYNVIEQ